MFHSMALGALIALGFATAAAAQPGPQPERRDSIGVGLHWALPIVGDDAPGVQLTWRRWLSPRIGIGTDARWWRTRTVTAIDSPAQQGPGGIAIASMEGQVDELISSASLGAGLLGRASAGRLSFVAGLGPGFFLDRRSHESRINQSHNAGTTMQRSIGVQALMEADVRAIGRWSVFAGLRLELRDVRSLESNSGYPTLGVRLAF